MAVIEHQARVTASKMVTPKILLLWVRPETAERFTFRAGQFLQVIVGPRIFRQYSICSAPAEPGDLLLCVDISPGGEGSRYMSQLRVGDIMPFRGPFGVFTLPHAQERPVMFVATGAGIAPIRSMVLDALGKNSSIQLELLFGNRSEEFLFFHEDFQRAAASPTFRYVPTLSQPGPSWSGAKGRVTDLLEQRSDLSGRSFFLCGSPAMVDNTRALLQQKGVVDADVHFEKFF